MNSVTLKDTKLIHRNLLHFYILLSSLTEYDSGQREPASQKGAAWTYHILTHSLGHNTGPATLNKNSMVHNNCLSHTFANHNIKKENLDVLLSFHHSSTRNNFYLPL